MPLGIATIESAIRTGGSVRPTQQEQDILDVGSWMSEVPGGFEDICFTPDAARVRRAETGGRCFPTHDTCTLTTGGQGVVIRCPNEQTMDDRLMGYQEETDIISSTTNSIIDGAKSALGIPTQRRSVVVPEEVPLEIQQAGIGPSLPWIVGVGGVVLLFGGLLTWHFWPK
jgi:hypothetical protein